jgi:hypothetical protein
MPAVRIHRYSVAPGDLDEFLVRRAALISAVRAEHPGLVDARLVRLRDSTFIDVWQWRTGAQMQAAVRAGVRALPEARAAMALTRDASFEDGEIVAGAG